MQQTKWLYNGESANSIFTEYIVTLYQKNFEIRTVSLFNSTLKTFGSHQYYTGTTDKKSVFFINSYTFNEHSFGEDIVT